LKINNTFLKNYKNLKVLVTGSTGFKGAWLCQWLYLLRSRVIGVGLKPEKGSILFNSFKLDKKIKQFYIDIKNFDKINNIIKKEKPDIVFHLAAQSIVSTSYTDPLETFGTNVIGSTNVLEAVRKNKIPNLVYITSDKCYLNLGKKTSFKENDILGGIDNYSSSKASAELIFASYFKSYYKNEKKLNIASARAGNVIGGGDFKKNRIVPDVVKSLNNRSRIILRSPNATRPWQHVLEPLSGYLLLGQKLMKKELKSSLYPSWNFGPYKKNCKKVLSIVKLLSREWSEDKIKINIKKNKKFHESKLLSLNIDKAYKELGWKPRLNLDETIHFTIDWYKSFFSKDDLEDITNYQIEYFIDK
tara:strand:- start:1939 stop:3015 length:1077 start_codon:yes stop_codon:yes gene_type:complete